MKKNLIYYILSILLISLIICWYFQGRISNNQIGYIAILVAIISAFFAYKQFKLTITLDKVQAITLIPEASAHIVRVNKFLQKNKDTVQNICRRKVENDNELYASVNFILGFFDDLAVAIKNDIIDERLVKESMGKFLKDTSEGLSPYISELEQFKEEQVYRNLNWLQKRWK